MLSSVIFAFVTISGIVILRGPNVSGPDSLFCINVVTFSLLIAQTLYLCQVLFFHYFEKNTYSSIAIILL